MTTKPKSPESSPKNPQKPGEKPADAPKEIGGRQGPEPTRYGDWENGGKCVDF